VPTSIERWAFIQSWGCILKSIGTALVPNITLLSWRAQCLNCIQEKKAFRQECSEESLRLEKAGAQSAKTAKFYG
jgi:hypothetical protein